MIGIVVMKRQQVKMLKRRNMAEHRKVHIENAKRIRVEAEKLKATRETVAESVFGFIPIDVRNTIDDEYNNMLAEAIAEENSKCMDRNH